MKRRLILFAKRPCVGEVKTRLVPPLHEDQALRLYRAFLTDQLALLQTLHGDGFDCELCTDEPWQPDGELRSLTDGLALTSQGPGDLGDRMLRAFRRSTEDAAATVILAVDAPTLPERIVREAFDSLERGAGAVLSAARDGGYVLLGMGAPRPELFRDVPWGTEEVLAATRRRAARSGLTLVEVEPWYDVDDEPGLRTLADDLSESGTRGRAPATARCIDGLFGESRG